MAKRGILLASFLIALVLFGISYFLQNSNNQEVLENIPMFKEQNTESHKVEVSAWYPEWDEKDAMVSLQTANVTQVLPFWYRLTENADIVEIKTDYKARVLDIAKRRNIEVIPSIVNDFDGKRVHKFLVDKKNWERFADALVLTGVKYDFTGFDLDWEELDAEDKDAFNEFVEYLAKRLEEKDLKLSVTVHAQSGEAEPRDAIKAQDLRTLALYADEIRVMVYDFHHAESKAGPVTPIEKLKQVVTYTKKLVPAEKIVIGLPTYGYDWVGSKGEALQYDEVLARLKKNKVNYKEDSINKALTAEYNSGGKHTIWFDNAETLLAKIKVVEDLGVYKISLWRLGGEDEKIWERIK